jgi:nitrite reductase (NADH) small subunit
MQDFIELAKTSDLAPGRARACTIGGRTIALYHTSDGYFATDNTCPHRGGPLAEGDLIGNEIVCPWHLWGFDVKTGVCTGNAEIQVVAHEVRLDADRVMVKLS